MKKARFEGQLPLQEDSSHGAFCRSSPIPPLEEALLFLTFPIPTLANTPSSLAFSRSKRYHLHERQWALSRRKKQARGYETRTEDHSSCGTRRAWTRSQKDHDERRTTHHLRLIFLDFYGCIESSSSNLDPLSTSVFTW